MISSKTARNAGNRAVVVCVDAATSAAKPRSFTM